MGSVPCLGRLDTMGATELHGHFPTGQVQTDPPTWVTQAGQPLGIVRAPTGAPGGGYVGRGQCEQGWDEESRGGGGEGGRRWGGAQAPEVGLCLNLSSWTQGLHRPEHSPDAGPGQGARLTWALRHLCPGLIRHSLSVMTVVAVACRAKV